MGGRALCVSDLEIPLLLMLFYLFHGVPTRQRWWVLVLTWQFIVQGGKWKTASGGEFGWGGTSVKG